MQKKFEKLPGLSNVSGKYTKKCPNDVHPRHVGGRTYSAALSPGLGSSFPSPLRARDKSVIQELYYQAQPSESSVVTSNPANHLREEFATEHRGDYSLTTSAQQQTNVTSPCRPMTQTAILTESTTLSDSSSARPFESMKRVKKPSDIVKSSSSGSVVSLGRKPTGIILATPSTSREGERRAGKLNHVSDKTQYTAKVGVSRQQGPSTPYPARQTYGQFTSQTHSSGFASRSSAYSIEHSKGVQVSAFDSTVTSTRPSMLVRPISLRLHSNPSLLSSSTESGDSIHSYRRFPCMLTKKYSISSSASNRPQSPSYPIGMQHTTFASPTSSDSSGHFQDEAPSRSLPQSRSMPATALVLPPSCLPRFTRNLHSTELSNAAWGAPNAHDLNPSNCQHCISGPPVFPKAPDHYRSHEIRGRHSSWGSENFTTNASGSMGTMPGPQYTQCALEQYLSDLIAEECLLPTDVEQADIKPNEWEPRTVFTGTGRDSGTLNRLDSSNLFEPLRFLERRISAALQGMRRDDMHHSTSLTSGLQARCLGRDQDGSTFTTPRRFSPVAAAPTFVSSNRAIDTEPVCASSALRSEPMDRSSTASDSDRFDCRSDRQRNNMLEQFNEDELRYLLKAVQDLLVLRSQSSAVTSSATHQRTAHDYEHHSEAGADLNCNYSCDISAPGGSRTSSRSSSCVRAGRLHDHAVSGEERVTTASSATVSATEIDPSTADIMHKRLPLGFQHFKRYLDNKFGPDHPQHRSGSVAQAGEPESGSQRTPRQPVEQMPQSASVKPKYYGALDPGLPRSSIHSPVVHHDNVDTSTTRSDWAHCWPDSEHALSNPLLGSHDITTVGHSASDQCYMEPTPQAQVDHTTQAHTSAQPCAHRILATSPSSLYWDSDIQAVESPSTHAYEERDGASPQHFDVSQSAIPHTAYLPFHQRSYCSTPEVPESNPSRNFDPAHSRWSPHLSHCYWWPQFTTNFGVHYPYFVPSAMQRVTSSTSGYVAYPHEICRCEMGYHVPGYQSPWPRSQHIATAAPCGSHLRYPDGSRFFSNTRPPSETPLSPMQGAQGNAMPLPGYIGNQAFEYVTTTDGGVQNYASWDYADRVSNVSFIYPGPIRTHYALPTSPTYDPALFSSAGFLNSRFPHQHYSTVSPSYYFRMPRSGSAGAGFSCAADTPIGVTNRQPPPGDRISRGRSVGPDPNGLGQTQPPQPLPRPSYRCLAARCAAASNHAASGRMSSNLSPPLTQEHTSALPSVGRSMSNSLSANDLASYRTKTGLEMRSTKSSFDLAPDLPCEPNLALAHCSDFYTRIAALIELDNNLQLATPSGWSERRSSLGRTYYTCDQTKQASWHHPTFGLHVPLGWERVDSYHHGVYYQHLLIPHCQRYHPNLWLLGPLKDPSVERENFFSDLRYLQSSMRHSLEIDCPDLENYKNTISAEEEIAFTDFLKQFDVETMVEVTRALDQLFYKELHAIIVYFEQERMRIVSTMFAMQQAEHIIPSIGDS